MLRFPVEREIPSCCHDYSQAISILAFNEEWTITFDFKTLRISRKSNREDIYYCVSGWIFYMQVNRLFTVQELSKLMKPTSFSLKVELKNPFIPEKQDFPHPLFITTMYKLSGMVYITSLSKTIGKCKNCQSLEKLSNDFERLLDPETSMFSDFHLKCGDVLIPTHKNILYARSPVFAAMFAHEMKENKKNEVVVTGINELVLRSMLTFMYTGKVPLTIALASDLLCVANKCQMDDLNKVCCDFLKENISSENMLKIYVLGDLYAEDLKSFVRDYICMVCTDFSAFETTKEWENFKKEKPYLALDVAISMVKLRDRKSKDAQDC